MDKAGKQLEQNLDDLGDIIEAALLAHFSDADVNGLVLSEGEARYITGGILLLAKQNR